MCAGVFICVCTIWVALISNYNFGNVLSLAAGGFLTLEAEHVFHDDSPFIYVGRSALIISLIKGSCGGKRNR